MLTCRSSIIQTPDCDADVLGMMPWLQNVQRACLACWSAMTQPIIQRRLLSNEE